MKKNQLLKTQKKIFSHIYNKKDIAILDELFPYSEQESLARLDIYRNNIFGNFISVLSNIFSVTKKILGEKKFYDIADKYAKTHFSRSGNLDDYGFFFPVFLQKNIKIRKLNFLSELAKLELSYHKIFFTEKTNRKLSIAKLKKVDVEKFNEIIFQIHESCILFDSKFSIYSIWKNEKKITKKPEFCILINNDKPLIIKLSEAEFLFIKKIIQKKNIYKIYNEIIAKNLKINIGKTLSKLIENKVIINFKLHEK